MISIPNETIYLPCYRIDPASKRMSLGKYNYTETLQKMKESTPPEGRTYWGEPDEYGRVYVDPNNPRQATLEPADAASLTPADLRAVQRCLGSSGLPAVESGRTEEKQRARKEEEREEQIRLLREEREQMARQEALVRRLARTTLSQTSLSFPV